MFKQIIKWYRKWNPFIKTIKVVFDGATFERHGNCIDIGIPKRFLPKSTVPRVYKIPLGFKATLPKHYRGVLYLRSSTPIRYNYSMPAGHGEIEWDYSEEWQGIIQASEVCMPAKKGTRLFQFFIEPVWDAPWYIKVVDLFSVFRIEEVTELNTSRSGLGSSGN